MSYTEVSRLWEDHYELEFQAGDATVHFHWFGKGLGVNAYVKFSNGVDVQLDPVNVAPLFMASCPEAPQMHCLYYVADDPLPHLAAWPRAWTEFLVPPSWRDVEGFTDRSWVAAEFKRRIRRHQRELEFESGKAVAAAEERLLRDCPAEALQDALS